MADNLADLTDLIAAHQVSGEPFYTSPPIVRWVVRCSCGKLLRAGDHPAHVALVVEQHTNERTAELEMLQQVDRDLLAKSVAVANDYKARAKKAEATIYRVKNALPNIEGINRASSHYDKGWDRGQQILTEHIQSAITGDYLRAALEGEQQ